MLDIECPDFDIFHGWKIIYFKDNAFIKLLTPWEMCQGHEQDFFIK